MTNIHSNNINVVLDWEKQLYSNLSVADKYDLLEKIRLELDRLYNEDRPVYEEYKAALKPNTWDALEENWTLWNPVPKSNAEWVGPGEMTCVLKPSNTYYKECEEKGFTKCTYDVHGSPDFNQVTVPYSVVDISDLYDSLSVDNIQKRGGSPYSLQEIAQERMAKKLKEVIREWAKETNSEEDFWEWRNALNLVPHEDTNCRTMRLVYRPVHLAFKHRGGVANAINIKNHFGS